MKLYPFSILVLFLFSSTGSYAQRFRDNDGLPGKGTFEIHTGYGIITLTNFAFIYSGGRQTELAAPTPQGTVSLDAKYYICKWFAAGFTGGVEFMKGDIQGNTPRTQYWSGKYTERHFTVAPEVTFVFAAKHDAIFYTSFALCYSRIERSFRFNQDSYNASFYNGVSSLPDGESINSYDVYHGIGLRFGGTVGGFIQLGLGFKGLVNAGLSFKL